MGNGSAGFNPSFNSGVVTSLPGAGRTAGTGSTGSVDGFSLASGTGGGDVVSFTSTFGTSAGSTPGNTNVASIVRSAPSQDPASVIGFPGGLDALRNPLVGRTVYQPHTTTLNNPRLVK